MLVRDAFRISFVFGLASFIALGTESNGEEKIAVVAFPGAEGWGAVSRGGREGKVIAVTNLDASGPGSLAEACRTEGPRIVVFQVSGVIRGDIRITHPNITIAGQTAPGAGITIEGVVSSYDHGVHDVILRHLRMRPRRATGAGGDCIQLGIGLVYWMARLWIKTSRGEMHDDPVVYALKDRGSRLTVLAMITAVMVAHFSVLEFFP